MYQEHTMVLVLLFTILCQFKKTHTCTQRHDNVYYRYILYFDDEGNAMNGGYINNDIYVSIITDD